MIQSVGLLKSFLLLYVSLLLYENKYHLKVYLDNCIDKIIDKQMIDYLDDNIF